MTREGKPFSGLMNFPRDGDWADLVKAGFERAVISTVDSVMAEDAMRALDAGFKHILLEKPGAITASEL